jgi:glycosyltransferase involved in cell wall biosynthesis
MVQTKKSFAVFIPAYNEENTIGEVLEGLKHLEITDNIFVIDDGSNDSTLNIAMEKEVSVIKHRINLGGGAAIKTAIAVALMNEIDYIVTLDADNQHNPKELPFLLNRMSDDIGLLIGSRFLKKSDLNMKRYRSYGVQFFSWLVSKIIKRRITDVTSGYRIYNAKDMKNILNSLHENQYYSIESLITLARNDSIIVEEPIRDVKRVKGKSKKGVLKYVVNLFKVIIQTST